MVNLGLDIFDVILGTTRRRGHSVATSSRGPRIF